MRSYLLLGLALGCVEPGPPDDLPEDPPACSYARGRIYDQVLVNGDGREDRTYFLYVPESGPCDERMPLLVDFHGTAGAQPEIAYATDELIAFAEEHHVVVARPRSRSATTSGRTWYQWDINAGDLPRNQVFAKNLVASLSEQLPIDTERVYASGFSSGANMAASFLALGDSPFRGVAPIAGGLWATGALPDLTAGPRLYSSTGYRDYLWDTARTLHERVRDAGLPDSHLYIARSGGGHELHGWSFPELFAFLDRGERATNRDPLAAGWIEETVPEPADINVLARDGGDLVAAGQHGRVWRRDADSWHLELSRGAADYTALCFGSQHAFVGGSAHGATRTPAGWMADAIVPDYGGFHTPSVTSASCRADGSIVIVGNWTAAITSDGGATWSRLHAPVGGGIDGWMAGVATAPGGATVVAGYSNYLGRVSPGATTAVPTLPLRDGWWNAVAATSGGRFWAVGDSGTVAVSTDDGMTWMRRPTGITDDLYAVHFADAMHGAAVGRRGTVLVTDDGGLTWTQRPLGRSAYLGAVFVDETSIWVAGEDGLVARSPR